MESNYVCSNSDAIERNGSVYSSSAGKLRYLRIIFMVIAVPVLVISLLLEIVSNAKHKMVSKKKTCNITVYLSLVRINIRCLKKVSENARRICFGYKLRCHYMPSLYWKIWINFNSTGGDPVLFMIPFYYGNLYSSNIPPAINGDVPT